VRRLIVVMLCALAVAPAALAEGPTKPAYDKAGNLVETPFAPVAEKRLTDKRAIAIFLRDDKVASWLERYPKKTTRAAEFDGETATWTVRVWWGEAGEVAEGKVDDETGRVTEAWTGPQVAWTMARGGSGAFGGREINRPVVWIVFCVVFLLGLADLRRPLAVRNLDLLVLLSFSVSLWFFNHGDILTSVPLAYPPLVYLLLRMLWIAWRGLSRPSRPVWPVWALAAATVFLAGFRVGLNVQDGNVIDVGYAGVIGAHRIVNGEAPYGHMPTQGSLPACGTANASGEIRERIQTNGRCESSNDRGDTYGPAAYLAYVPGYLAFGWTGKWDDLPAAHATSLLFDLIALAAMALAGRRFGGLRGAATMSFAWAAFPFTQYVSSSATNDAIPPALLMLGFWLVTSPWWRGAFCALSGWTKFASLVVAPLWLSYPDRREKRPFLVGFAIATVLAFAVLLLEPNLLHAARTFWERTFGFQLDRRSPFSIWEWRQYHAQGLPDLHLGRTALELLLLAGAVLSYFVPRRKSPLQLAALTAALLIGFELVLTHWFYLYIPWFFPFVAFAVLAPAAAAVRVQPSPADERDEAPALVTAG
jgi:hypothetical protein